MVIEKVTNATEIEQRQRMRKKNEDYHKRNFL
jgi:hypothetical protein